MLLKSILKSNMWTLAIACLLYLVPMTSNLYGISAWIAPTLLLIYMYREKARTSIPISIVALTVVMSIANQGIIPGGAVYVTITILLSTVVLIAVLLLNRWFVLRTSNAVSLLFFPLLMTAFDYFSSYGNVFGTFNSAAYSQLAIKPIAIWASVFGIWGIVFIQYLIASLLAYVFKPGFYKGLQQHKRVWICAMMMMLLLVGGGALLDSARDHDQAATIKATGITPNRILWDDTIEQLLGAWTTVGFYEQITKHPDLVKQIDQINEHLLLRTEQELEQGSRLISWSEGASIVLEHDEQTFIQRLQSLSTAYEAVMIVGYVRVNTSDGREMDNQVVIIDADGTIKAEYSKFSLVPGEELFFNKGVEEVPVVETAVGTIAVAICFDADFPHRILEAGRMNADLLVIPSSDWEEITPYHTRMSAFRAIENHMSVLRVTHAGVSAVYNANGDLIGEKNDFDSDSGIVFSVDIPYPKYKESVYKTIGDLLPLLCGAAVLFIVAMIMTLAMIRKVLRKLHGSYD